MCPLEQNTSQWSFKIFFYCRSMLGRLGCSRYSIVIHNLWLGGVFVLRKIKTRSSFTRAEGTLWTVAVAPVENVWWSLLEEDGSKFSRLTSGWLSLNEISTKPSFWCRPEDTVKDGSVTWSVFIHCLAFPFPSWPLQLTPISCVLHEHAWHNGLGWPR